MMKKKIPKEVKFLDIQAQNRALKKALLAAVGEVLDGSRFILGPEVGALEKDIAHLTHAKTAIGVNSGTDALLIALKALDLGRGDEVLVPDFSFMATASAVMLAGATPVMVDIDPETFMLDLDAAAKKLTRKTKAIIPVHLYGQAANMTSLMAFAKQAKLAVVEDAAQALGATWRGKAVGTFGDFGCFSFFPTKNLGGLGDGGMVLTQKAKLARRALRLRQHGANHKYIHEELGYNSRLDSLQAAALRVKLPYLPWWNERRQSMAAAYSAGLNGLVDVPKIQTGATHVFHQYAILTAGRDRLQLFLKGRQINTAIHYPLPLHRQPAFSMLASAKKDYPVANAVAHNVLCLPIAPEIRDQQVRRVIAGIRQFFKAA